MSLQHASLEIRAGDVPAELSFWALLGFEHVEAPSGLGGRATWVARGGTHIHLLHADAPTVVPRGHVAILADDYDSTLTRLRDAGLRFEPADELWGAPRGFVRTPAGQRGDVMPAAPPP